MGECWSIGPARQVFGDLTSIRIIKGKAACGRTKCPVRTIGNEDEYGRRATTYYVCLRTDGYDVVAQGEMLDQVRFRPKSLIGAGPEAGLAALLLEPTMHSLHPPPDDRVVHLTYIRYLPTYVLYCDIVWIVQYVHR